PQPSHLTHSQRRVGLYPVRLGADQRMEQRALTIQRREGTGRSVAKRLRRTGRVPGILYGGPAAVPITTDPRDVLRLIHGHEGSTQLLTLTFDGSTESRMALIRDMQFDPVSEALVHVDLQEVG